MKKFHEGQKVALPKTKSAGWGRTVESSVVSEAKENGQDFLYVTGYEDKNTVVLSPYYTEGIIDGDFFMEYEVELYPMEFKQGDRVKIPTRKTAGRITLEESEVIQGARERGQDYLIVKYIYSRGKEIELVSNENHSVGELFRAEDLELHDIATRKSESKSRIKELLKEIDQLLEEI